MKEALSSSETSVLTRATRRNIPENAILRLQLIWVPVNEDIDANKMADQLAKQGSQ
jgi:hypothetical protein